MLCPVQENEINLRTQCIDQLTKWHRLMEDGVISQNEYEEMHKPILSDIKKFSGHRHWYVTLILMNFVLQLGWAWASPTLVKSMSPPPRLFICIFVYIYLWRYDRQTPAPSPGAANFLIYCTLRKKYLNFLITCESIWRQDRSFSLSVATCYSLLEWSVWKLFMEIKHKGLIFQ